MENVNSTPNGHDKATPRRHPPVKRTVRNLCLDVIESSGATVGEKLHAADLLLMLMGLGSRTGAGRIRKKRGDKAAAMAQQVKAVKSEKKAQHRSGNRDRLHDLIGNKPTPDAAVE